jgi:hypothetical protein
MSDGGLRISLSIMESSKEQAYSGAFPRSRQPQVPKKRFLLVQDSIADLVQVVLRMLN